MTERWLTSIAVLILIAAAYLFSGHSETTLEQQCLQRASAAACRRI